MKILQGKRLAITAAAAAFLLASLGCSDGPTTDSETHWLKSCQADGDCGDELQCLCGVCTTGCDADCSDVSEAASCIDVAEKCEDVDGSICSAECTKSDDCPDGFACDDGVCHPQDGWLENNGNGENAENGGDEPPQPTLPRYRDDIDCGTPATPWYDLCGWIRDVDAVVYGTIDDMTFYEVDDGVPIQPLESCDDRYAMRVGLSDVESLYGEVDEDIDVFISNSLSNSWGPTPRCDEDAPATPEWGNLDFYTDDGVGPLEVGQSLGLAIDEHEAGHFHQTNRFETGPLFLERDDHLYLQDGRPFVCHPIEGIASELESMTFEEFRSEVEFCGELNLEEDCKLQGDFPCRDGADCCPTGCLQHRGDVYDLENECRIEGNLGGGYASYYFGCGPRPLEPYDADGLYCTPEGTYAIDPRITPGPATDPEIIPCADLDDFQDDEPDVTDLPDCE